MTTYTITVYIETMKKRTNIYLTERQWQTLVTLSKQTGETASVLIRRAVDEYLERQARKKRP